MIILVVGEALGGSSASSLCQFEALKPFFVCGNFGMGYRQHVSMFKLQVVFGLSHSLISVFCF